MVLLLLLLKRLPLLLWMLQRRKKRRTKEEEESGRGNAQSQSLAGENGRLMKYTMVNHHHNERRLKITRGEEIIYKWEANKMFATNCIYTA